MPLTTKFDLDLDEAWKRAIRRANKAEVPDILRWEDYKLAWPTSRDELIAELDAGQYNPRQANVVEVPKDGFTVRPIAQLHPDDHVVLEAVVGSLAEKIDAALPSDQELFSARFRSAGNGTYKLRRQRDEWLRFQAKAREKYDEYDEAFMLSTDVASYFEYVEIEILIKELKALDGIPTANVDLLSNILNNIERSSDIWGLPQGLEASAILGNFYLLEVDRALVGKPVQPLRFQDDLKIFGQSPDELRKALRDIIRSLRSRRLNVSVRKTKLLEGEEILTEIEDTRKDAIQYGLDVGDTTAVPSLKALFDEAVVTDPINARDIRFAVYRFQKEGDSYAIPWILENLANAPWLSELLVEYLSSQFSDEIEAGVTEYLNDQSQNLYPYVELQLVRMFARAAELTDASLDTLRSVALDANKETYVCEHAIRALGRHAKPGDPGWLRTQFNNSTHPRIRRALMVAVTEAAGVDKGWLNTVANADGGLAYTAKFLASGANLPDP